MSRYFAKPCWFVVEREASMNAKDNCIIMGSYWTESEADEARQKYFGDNPNYYIKLIEDPNDFL
jgi:hypothetical protein